MGLNAKKVEGNGGGKRQDALEAGAYPVRLVQVIDLGVQNQRPFKGEEKDPAHEIAITYEFLDEFMVDEDGNVDEDKPRVLTERFPLYNLEADRAKSTKRYLAFDPKVEADGEWTDLIGNTGILTITATEGKGNNAGTIYNNVVSLSSMRPKEADKAPELKQDPKVFLLDTPNIDVLLSLPKFMQDWVTANNNFDGSELQEKLANNTTQTNREEGVEEEGNEDQQEEADNGEW